MTSNTVDPSPDVVQIVNDIIDNILIDNAVKSVERGSTTESTYTEMKWTSACEELLRTYREKIHLSVRPASKNNHDVADALCRLLVNLR